MASRRFTVNETTSGATTNGFSFYSDAIRGPTGFSGPQGPQGPPGPTGPAGESASESALNDLTDVADALATAEDGTTLVRVSGEWVKNSYSRIAIGYGTNLAVDGNQTIALGFGGTGDSHIFGAGSASAIAIGDNVASLVHGVSIVTLEFIFSDDTTILVNDATGIADGQTIKIEAELITVGTVSGNNLTGCTRGIAPSSAVNHSESVSVLVIDLNADFPLDLYYGPTGNVTNNSASVAIGSAAAVFEQNAFSTAIGNFAGRFYQGTRAVSIGYQAGENCQGLDSVSIGSSTGRNNQATYAISIGYQSGYTTQSTFGIAFGYQAGYTTQGSHGIGFGYRAGYNTQGFRAIAIGYNAGLTSQGATSIAFGARAGEATTHDNSIIINATGSALNSTGEDKLFIKPIASAGVGTGITIGPPAGKQMMCYDTSTGEVSYFTQV